MRKLLVLSVIVCTVAHVQAQELRTIELNVPSRERGLSVMAALSQRQSIREYADRQLELQDLSDLLWAAVGINRPESGKRTAPTALNRQEIGLGEDGSGRVGHCSGCK